MWFGAGSQHFIHHSNPRAFCLSTPGRCNHYHAPISSIINHYIQLDGAYGSIFLEPKQASSSQQNTCNIMQRRLRYGVVFVFFFLFFGGFVKVIFMMRMGVDRFTWQCIMTNKHWIEYYIFIIFCFEDFRRLRLKRKLLNNRGQMWLKSATQNTWCPIFQSKCLPISIPPCHCEEPNLTEYIEIHCRFIWKSHDPKSSKVAFDSGGLHVITLLLSLISGGGTWTKMGYLGGINIPPQKYQVNLTIQDHDAKVDQHELTKIYTLMKLQNPCVSFRIHRFLLSASDNLRGIHNIPPQKNVEGLRNMWERYWVAETGRFSPFICGGLFLGCRGNPFNMLGDSRRDLPDIYGII